MNAPLRNWLPQNWLPGFSNWLPAVDCGDPRV